MSSAGGQGLQVLPLPSVKQIVNPASSARIRFSISGAGARIPSAWKGRTARPSGTGKGATLPVWRVTENHGRRCRSHLRDVGSLPAPGCQAALPSGRSHHRARRRRSSKNVRHKASRWDDDRRGTGKASCRSGWRSVRTVRRRLQAGPPL